MLFSQNIISQNISSWDIDIIWPPWCDFWMDKALRMLKRTHVDSLYDTKCGRNKGKTVEIWKGKPALRKHIHTVCGCDDMICVTTHGRIKQQQSFILFYFIFLQRGDYCTAIINWNVNIVKYWYSKILKFLKLK